MTCRKIKFLIFLKVQIEINSENSKSQTSNNLNDDVSFALRYLLFIDFTI